ncbi:type I restriction enzyme S subunit [Amycolatopsis bartoniae]|uniref:Type I restriction modification DNA specificity domain-containing protein n=1 Tax=Amycolatopsis bartoniae TaxID=941986 RepID=A0A8H9IRU2_9PSEU|nr:restriction endonuclease subunit S [Amycolatopsis bartoniae]MBB2936869.1 type I restriction enzyme S subunit [Amycolatopsis bartoniae]GHF50783.1 hypothetical protein GCM10017566_24880 [Amycolatopsis bartoniae]
MTNYPRRALGEALALDLDEVRVDDNSTYKIAGVYGFGRGLFKREAIKGNDTSYKKLNRLHGGHIVMSRLKAFEGAIAAVPDQFEGWFLSQEFPTFRVDESQAYVGYIRYICGWPEFWTMLSSESKGIGSRRERVSAERLLSIRVPLPNLEEQHRIAAELDSAFSNLDRAHQLRSQMRRKSAALVEALMSTSVDSAENEVRLCDVLRLERRPVQVNPSGNYREIGVKSFGKGIFHKAPISGVELGAKRVFHIEPGDLVFSNVFAWEGAVAVASEAERGFIGSHRFMTYRVNSEIADRDYLFHYFTSRLGLETIRRASPGSAGRNRTLGIEAFAREKVRLPDTEKQKNIGAMLTALREKLESAKSDEHLEALRLSLLNAAFTGQL